MSPLVNVCIGACTRFIYIYIIITCTVVGSIDINFINCIVVVVLSIFTCTETIMYK